MRYVLISVIEVMVTSALLLALIFCGCMIFMGSVCRASEKPAIEKIIRKEAKRQGFDADLAVAIAKVESNLNPNAKGKFNEVGLFQLRPDLYPTADNDPTRNSVLGIRNLKRVRAQCIARLKSDFFLCWNYGVQGALKLKHPRATAYYKRVNALYIRKGK